MSKAQSNFPFTNYSKASVLLPLLNTLQSTNKMATQVLNYAKPITVNRLRTKMRPSLAPLNETDEYNHYPGFRPALRLLHSTNQSESPPPQKSYPTNKHVSVIGNHPIANVFEHQIKDAISALNVTKSMDSIYVIRIGYQGDERDPPILLLIMKPGSVSSMVAKDLAKKVKSICNE